MGNMDKLTSGGRRGYIILCVTPCPLSPGSCPREPTPHQDPGQEPVVEGRVPQAATRKTATKPSTWLPPGGLVEQDSFYFI